MSVQRPINDADADIAALVYSRGDRPDLVLCDFARHLAGTGRRICGLVQFRDGSFDRAYRRVLILDDWRMVMSAARPSRRKKFVVISTGIGWIVWEPGSKL